MYCCDEILQPVARGRVPLAVPAGRTLVCGAPGAGVSSIVRQLLAAQQRAPDCPVGGPLRVVEASGEEDALGLVGAARGASTALVVLNALQPRAGVTRRYAFAARLLSVARLVIAVNKMDLVGYAAQAFGSLELELLAFAQAQAARWHIVPVSAREGEMVVARADRMPWYAGPTLAEALVA